MKRVISFFLFVMLISSCNKEEKNYLIWDVSLGPGTAYCIKALPDTGFFACGDLNGSPCFAVFDGNRKQVFDIKSSITGLYSSAWFDTSSIVLAGSHNRKLLLEKYDLSGNKSWSKSVDTNFNIDLTSLHYTGNGNLIAIGSADADSLSSGDSGILFLIFDTTGNFITRKDIQVSGYISARNSDFDSEGNIYLALTRQSAGSRQRASIAKYSPDLNLIWESDLFNNPGFSSACLAVKNAGARTFFAGRTELPSGTGTIMNSFILSVDKNGALPGDWSKKYPETDNEGTSLVMDKDNNILMLNRNCMVFRRFSSSDGSEGSITRTFGVCSAKTTDAFGNVADLDAEGNILIAGSVGGKFYLSMKSPQ
jgi:hypothetical protein